MLKNKYVLFCLVLFILAGPLWGEDRNLKTYVTKIDARVKDSSIILTWQNDKDAGGALLIYIYSEKIDSSNIGKARKVATLDGEKESFVYYPEDKQPYYFAVNYALANGGPNKVCVDYRNVTVTPVRVLTLGTEKELATTITLLTAKVEGDHMSVSFLSSRPRREVILYRNTAPILTADDLLSASFYVALDSATTMYKDYPLPGIDYYYAVLDAGLVKLGQIELEKHQNTTVIPVRLKSDAANHEAKVNESQRTLPLPLLALSSEVESGSGLVNSPSLILPAEKKITPETAAVVAEILAGISLKEEPKTEVGILDIDTIEEITGEAYSLQTIVNEYVNKLLYRQGEAQLKEFLRIRRAPDVEARTRFYLGQMYYFQQKYEPALLEFLLASDVYYTSTQEWIDSCFLQLIE